MMKGMPMTDGLSVKEVDIRRQRRMQIEHKRKRCTRKKHGIWFLCFISCLCIGFGGWYVTNLFTTQKTYEDIVFDDGLVNVPYYNQTDSRWAEQLYGTDPIATHACGPVSMGMVIEAFTGQPSNPVAMAEWAFENGYYAEGSGSYHSLIPDMAEAFGLQVESLNADRDSIVSSLQDGKLIVALMGKGTFANSGHFIVLRGNDVDGRILVADSNSFERSLQAWDIVTFLEEARMDAHAGGPFWAVSLEG